MLHRRSPIHGSPRVSWRLSFFAVLVCGAAVWAQQTRTPPTQDVTRPPLTRPPGAVQTPATPQAAAAPIAYQPMSAARAEALVDAANRGVNYVSGEVLVQFKSGVTVADEQRALQAVRSQPSVGSLRWVGQVALLSDVTQPDANVLAAQLSAQPEVQFAEPNYIRHRGSVIPNDPGYPSQWNLPAIQMPDAWTISPGADSSIVVAVVDTGITSVASQTFTFSTWGGTAIQKVNILFKGNPDLAVSRLASPYDFVTGMGTTVLDTDGHGTHVSATIGEDTNNGLNEAGIAYNARIMPVKVCSSFWDVQFAWSAAGHTGLVPVSAGGCADSDIAAGIQYAADNGASVINLSLGGPGTSTILNNALTYAVGKGAFIAMAAGNDYQNGNPTEYPAAYAPNINGAMSVAAVGQSLKQAFYSNTGSYIEIAAPGGDSQAQSGNQAYIWQSTYNYTYNDITIMSGFIPRFDIYGDIGYEGTSMATAHVSGVAALLMSRGIKNPATVEAIIEASALDLGTPGLDNTFGYGLIQARAALFGQGVIK
jgi:serine protease